MADRISVKASGEAMANAGTDAARSEGERGQWVFNEVHPDHYRGHAIVRGDGKAVKVAPTPAVLKALAKGKLVEVEVRDKDGRNRPND